MIDCAAFEGIVDRLLDGTLSAHEMRDAELHASLCARCGELLSLVRGDAEIGDAHAAVDPLDVGAGDRLTAGILSRTSGSPCSRAEALLCDRVDGTLPASESELLDLHLASCTGCAGLAAALMALRLDLPAMAEIDPDPWFVRDVLDATTRRAPAGVGEPALAAARSIESWGRRLFERPRLALELAYSGAMVIFLLWGTPVSPLRGTAEKALSVMRADPAGGIADAVRSGEVLAGRSSVGGAGSLGSHRVADVPWPMGTLARRAARGNGRPRGDLDRAAHGRWNLGCGLQGRPRRSGEDSCGGERGAREARSALWRSWRREIGPNLRETSAVT